MAEPIKNQNPVLPGIQKLTTPQVKTSLTNFDGADFLSFFESEIAPAPKPLPNKVEEPPKKIPLKSKEKEQAAPRELETKERPRQEEPKPKKVDRRDSADSNQSETRESSRSAEDDSVDQSKVDAGNEEANDVQDESRENSESEQSEDRTSDNEERSGETEEGQEVQSNEQANASESSQVNVEESASNEEISLQMGLNVLEEGINEVLEVETEIDLDGISVVSETESNLSETKLTDELINQVQDLEESVDTDSDNSEEQLVSTLSPLIQIENLQASPELRDRLTELLENIEEGLEQGLFELEDSLGDEDFSVDLSQFIDLLKELIANPQPSLQPVVDSSAFQEQLIKVDELIDQSVTVFEDSVNQDSDGSELESLEFNLDDAEKSEKKSSKKNDNFRNVRDLDQSSDIKEVEVKLDDKKDSSTDKKINKMLAVARQGMSLRETIQEGPKQQQISDLNQMGQNEMTSELSQNLEGESQGGKQSSQQRTMELMNHLMHKGGLDKTNLSQRFAEVLEPAQKSQVKDPSGINTQEASTRKTQAGQMIRKPAFARSHSVILNQVIEASKGLKPPIMNSIKIILKPAHLGELRLEVKQLDDQLRVKLEADSQTVKEVLDKNSQAIRDSLRQQGLDVDRIEVELRQQKQDQQDQQAEQEAKDSNSNKDKDKKEFSLEDELAETLVPEDVLDHQGTQVNQLA